MRRLEVNEPTKKDALKWLKEEVNIFALLQTNSHVAYIPTDRDMKMFQSIKRLLKEGEK